LQCVRGLSSSWLLVILLHNMSLLASLYYRFARQVHVPGYIFAGFLSICS
jgi:hypothetical protein